MQVFATTTVGGVILATQEKTARAAHMQMGTFATSMGYVMEVAQYLGLVLVRVSHVGMAMLPVGHVHQV
jgi:hypothetical protein